MRDALRAGSRRRRHRRSRRAILVVLALALIGAPPALAHDIPAAGPQCDEDTAAFASRVLLFSETAGSRSDTIPAATAAICEAAGGTGIAVDHTEDSTAFDAHLADYDAVVFLHTTGDVLADPELAVLEAYVEDGGGFAAIGAAAEAEPAWPFFRSQRRPAPAPGRLRTSVRHLGRTAPPP